MFETGTHLNGTLCGQEVDVVSAYNVVNNLDLKVDTSWAPAFFTEIDPTIKVIPLVESRSGPFETWR